MDFEDERMSSNLSMPASAIHRWDRCVCPKIS